MEPLKNKEIKTLILTILNPLPVDIKKIIYNLILCIHNCKYIKCCQCSGFDKKKYCHICALTTIDYYYYCVECCKNILGTKCPFDDEHRVIK